jgi:psp operon transcriptional activator
MASELGWQSFPGFTRSALDALDAHPWPGNVRELRNVVERAVYRSGSPARPIAELQFDPFASPFRPAGPRDAPSAGGAADGPVDFRARVEGFERRLLAAALEACRHNQRAAAGRLGLTYDQLRHQLKKHALPAARG